MQFSPFISRLIPMRTLAAFILVLLPLHMSQGAYASESPDAFGVLVMAHGGSPEWNRSVEAAVEPLRSRYKIEIAFGMADAVSMQESVRKLEAQGARNIGVVRLFVSGESWYDRTRQILGIAPGAPEPPASAAHAHASRHHEHAQAHEHSMAFWRLNTKASFALTAQGLGEAPETAAILAERARALSRTPEREDVLILAHGPGDDAENRRWIAHIDARAEAVRQALPFRRVQVETLREDWPEKRKEAEARVRAFVTRAAADGGKAIVIPFRIQGFGPYARVLEGLDYVADRTGLLPHPSVTNWIEAQIVALRKGPFRSPNDANAVGATGAIAGEVSLAAWRDRGGALLAETRERVLDMDISRAAFLRGT